MNVLGKSNAWLRDVILQRIPAIAPLLQERRSSLSQVLNAIVMRSIWSANRMSSVEEIWRFRENRWL
jgi:hypothetical protein